MRNKYNNYDRDKLAKIIIEKREREKKEISNENHCRARIISISMSLSLKRDSTRCSRFDRVKRVGVYCPAGTSLFAFFSRVIAISRRPITELDYVRLINLNIERGGETEAPQSEDK